MYFALSTYASRDYVDLISKYHILDNLLFKEDRFISDRIPELAYIELYRNWKERAAALRAGSQ